MAHDTAPVSPARQEAGDCCCPSLTPAIERAAFDAFDNWTPDLHGPDSRGRLRAALRSALNLAVVPPSVSGGLPGVSEAYEQAAKWCEERAAKIRARAAERPAAYGGDGEGVAAWVEGCADTIRHNAEFLRAARLSPKGSTDGSR